MSDSHDPTPNHAAPEDEAHEGPIKTPRQLIATVVASFLVPITAIVLLVNFVDLGARTGAGSDAMSPQDVAARLAPVASVEIRDASNPGPAHTGEQVFQAQCSACHLVGALGSPKFGDAAAWAPRIAKGYEALLTSALKGKGNMTPQGGGEFTDYEIGRAVVYMADHGGAKFPDPPAPAASGAA
ncbi:MAG: cytochrome c5 family protein, partial [Burkholderiales bacterium]|nr:cytochrome c5 family protein [Burkholderiales bacterium]